MRFCVFLLDREIGSIRSSPPSTAAVSERAATAGAERTLARMAADEEKEQRTRSGKSELEWIVGSAACI